MKIKLLFCFLALSGIVNAQYTVLYNFNNETPGWGSLILTTTKLYGMTINGGTQDSGSIFSIDTNGSGYKTLFSFNGPNGRGPCGSLTLSGSQFYGMARYGGRFDTGCVFSIDTNGINYKDLLNFNPFNAIFPWGSLIYSQGILYGLTNLGQLRDVGSVFSVDTNGSNYSSLFGYGTIDGVNGDEPLGALTLSLSGKTLYGMFPDNGIYGLGLVFSTATNGSNFKFLHSFKGIDGQGPSGSLTLFGNILYGVTQYGGAHDSGCIFSIDTNGSRYKDMFDFNGTDGCSPIGSLMLSGSRLYGVAYVGGVYDSGCIFSIDTNGSGYKDMFDFNKTSGYFPSGSLTLSKKVLYGMTRRGGINDSGVIFSFKDTNVRTSINEILSNNGAINVYPNPNTGTFTLSLSNITEKCNVEIYNMLGEKIHTETLHPTQNENTINLTGQPSGIYFYRVVKETGGMVGNGKFCIYR